MDRYWKFVFKLVHVKDCYKRFIISLLCIFLHQDCFLQHRLRLEDNSEFYFVPETRGRQFIKIKLPEGLTCWQCILQWTYVVGNNWGSGITLIKLL